MRQAEKDRYNTSMRCALDRALLFTGLGVVMILFGVWPIACISTFFAGLAWSRFGRIRAILLANEDAEAEADPEDRLRGKDDR